MPPVLPYMVTICRRPPYTWIQLHYRALKRIAARKKRQPAELVREAVAEYAARHEPTPRAEERGRVRQRPPGSERARRRTAEGNGTHALIVADTGAILALLDKGDRHHAAVRELYEDRPDGWLLPWAILPEVDYLIGSELGRARAGGLSGRSRRRRLCRGVRQARRRPACACDCPEVPRTQLGLVDAVVIATPSGCAPTRSRRSISATSAPSKLPGRRVCFREMREHGPAEPDTTFLALLSCGRMQRGRRRHDALHAQVGRDRPVVLGAVHGVVDERVRAHAVNQTARRTAQPGSAFPSATPRDAAASTRSQ